jgi:polyhydroxybutyrate depolymerase
LPGPRGLLLTLAAALLVACEAGAAGSPAATRRPVPNASAGVASPTETASPRSVPSSSDGAAAVDFSVGGDRPVVVHVPAAYDSKHPAPLLIVLHGYGSSGDQHAAYFGLGPELERRGYVYAHPDGTLDSEGNRFWNATDACCDFDRSDVDDSAYLASVISEIRARVSVDPHRIAVIGHSNGGFMAYRLACDHADVLAAIVSLAGATYTEPDDCRPSGPVAVLQIHGTEDDVVEWGGGTLTGIGPPGTSLGAYPGAEVSAATWAKYDRCSSPLADTGALVDVDDAIRGPMGPAEATVARSGRCAEGGGVELWAIVRGGHGPELSASFRGSVLDFFDAHRKR